MKRILIISILLAFLYMPNLNSQIITDDTLAVVSLENSFRTTPSSLEFDLVLRRNSEIWRYYANSTFQFVFSEIGYNYNNLNVEMLPGTNDLMFATPGLQPYTTIAGVLDDRIQIIILGPEELSRAYLIAPNEAVRIGRYRVSSKDGSSVPDYIYWKRPILYYQAAAFKYDETDPHPVYILEVFDEDNIDMSNAGENFVAYADDATAPPAMSLEYFHAMYIGNLNVDLRFRTFSEYKAKGFIIKRTVRSHFHSVDLEQIDDEEFTYTVADYRQLEWEAMLTAQFTSKIGREYGVVNDRIDYRGVDYIYRLYYQDEDDNIHKLHTRSLSIPNAVIEYAQADPNPFQSETKVRYFVRDNVLITCIVFDRIGQQITKLRDSRTGKLLNNVEIQAGWHETIFAASEVTAQGSYDIVFIAYPINDPGIELSRAIVKVQYLIDRR